MEFVTGYLCGYKCECLRKKENFLTWLFFNLKPKYMSLVVLAIH